MVTKTAKSENPIKGKSTLLLSDVSEMDVFTLHIQPVDLFESQKLTGLAQLILLIGRPQGLRFILKDVER